MSCNCKQREIEITYLQNELAKIIELITLAYPAVGKVKEPIEKVRRLIQSYEIAQSQSAQLQIELDNALRTCMLLKANKGVLIH
jgi:hypothetical protein